MIHVDKKSLFDKVEVKENQSSRKGEVGEEKKTFEQFYVSRPWSVPPYISMSVLVER